MSKKLPRTSERTLDDLRKAANSVLKAEEKTFARITPASLSTAEQNQATGRSKSRPLTAQA